MNARVSFLLPCLLVAAPSTALASAEQGKDAPAFYVGAGVAANWLKGGQVPNQSDDVDSFNTSYKASFGWRVGGWVALEGQYIDFGTSEDDDDDDAQIDATGWTAALTAGMPVTPSLIPFAKAGALFWQSDRRFPVAGVGGQREVDGNGTDFFWGAGLNWRFAEHLDLRAEYERFTFGDYDEDDSGTVYRVDGAKANMMSLSLLYSF